MKTKPYKLIIIDGRRWFQRSYGNTYHSVTVTVKHHRRPDLVLASDQRYGYGDQYRQTASELLCMAGYFQDWNAFNEATRDHRDKFYFTVQDVARERDL